jgi:hypothetical protein
MAKGTTYPTAGYVRRQPESTEPRTLVINAWELLPQIA